MSFQLLYISQLAIVFSTIASFVGLRKHRSTLFYCFSVFLLLTFLVEMIGLFRMHYHLATTGLHNVYSLIEFLFYGFVYYQVIHKKSVQKWILYVMPVYLVIALVNQLYIQGFDHFHTYTYMLGALITITWVSVYLYQLLYDEPYINMLRVPMFWVSTGLLFFYVGNFLFTGCLNYLIEVNLELASALFVIVDLLNIIMYSLFGIGFLCQQKT